uniref:Integrase, catalytic region, zinc finger, CCHC-type, peptidase aspartic, catalytic n=1 Tax=Tanacetum cinerariifolium TaxID=118510 RepID=A0A6L2MT53_TANCI|nr:hypothetical protein [Tanacetum cinerariifolium]
METKDTLSSCSNSKEQQMQQIQAKAKKSCMVSFQQLHSHLKLLSNNDLKGTRTESRFKRAFATLFGQDLETFTGTMFLNMDQLDQQPDKEEFQEIGSMAAFKVLETQFQMFIKSQIYLDDEYKLIDEIAHHKREYDNGVNERHMQTIEEKVDTSKALDASLVDTKSSRTKSVKQDTSSRSGNDAHADDVDIIPIYDEEPMAEFASQVDVNNDLSKPVTTHYLPKKRKYTVVKPPHVIASSESRNSSKNMARFSSNDMVHNHYLEKAKKKTQESSRNSRPSVMASARSQTIANGSKPKPSTIKGDSEPPIGSNVDITNQYECEQTLDVSAGTLNLSVGTSFNLKKEGLRVYSELKIHDYSNEQSSSKLVPKVVPPADKTSTSRQELELLFHHYITMLR